MQLLSRNDEAYRIRVDTPDDLWVLSRLTRKGSLVGALTTRRDQTTAGEEGGRAKAAERKPMWVVLKVENHEFQPFTDQLRIGGIIVTAPFDKGSHHTHSIGAGDTIEIEMQGGMSELDLSLLNEAIKESTKSRSGILVVEADEVILYELSSRGIREVATHTMRGGGKRFPKSKGVRQAFFDGVAKQVNEIWQKDIPMIICGPGFARDEMSKRMDEFSPERDTICLSTAMGGRGAVQEILNGEGASRLLTDNAVAKETRLLNEAYSRLAQNGAVAYGKRELIASRNEGAIETLLITADLLRDENESIEWMQWDQWARQLLEEGAEVVQCSTDHDAGLELVGFGGAIALLRWSIA